MTFFALQLLGVPDRRWGRSRPAQGCFRSSAFPRPEMQRGHVFSACTAPPSDIAKQQETSDSSCHQQGHSDPRSCHPFEPIGVPRYSRRSSINSLLNFSSSCKIGLRCSRHPLLEAPAPRKVHKGAWLTVPHNEGNGDVDREPPRRAGGVLRTAQHPLRSEFLVLPDWASTPRHFGPHLVSTSLLSAALRSAASFRGRQRDERIIGRFPSIETVNAAGHKARIASSRNRDRISPQPRASPHAKHTPQPVPILEEDHSDQACDRQQLRTTTTGDYPH